MLSTQLVALLAVIFEAIRKVLRRRKEADEKAAAAVVPKTRLVFERPDYKTSTWSIMLQSGYCKVPGSRDYRLFRRRFGVGFERYRDIVEKTRAWGIFSEKNDSAERPCVPLELKVLGALRYLCKGCSFDAIAELSGMSENTANNFFHQFWHHFVLEYKTEWITYPTTAAEAKPITDHYARLGVPGAVGSVDCTHVWWAMCPAALTHNLKRQDRR